MVTRTRRSVSGLTPDGAAATVVVVIGMSFRLLVGPAHDPALNECEDHHDYKQRKCRGSAQASQRILKGVAIGDPSDRSGRPGRPSGGDHVNLVKDLECADDPDSDNEK